MTPLHWAARMQNTKIINILLSFGADPNKKDFEGATPLHTACSGSSLECIELLIAAGANPNLRDDFGTKASELIKKLGFEEVLNTPLKKNDIIVLDDL